MKPITNQLIEFLHKHIASTKQHIRFSNTSLKMIKLIFKQMKQAEQMWKLDKTKICTSATKITTVLPKGYNFEHCPEKMQAEITSTMTNGYIYSFKIENREFQVAIMCPNEQKYADAFFKDSIKRIFMWLFISNLHAPAKCSQKMNIYLYLTDETKRLPTTMREHIGQDNANSAATTSCQRVTEINLYRMEEWFKVLMHETFHCLGLDFSEFDTARTNRQILAIFPVKSDVRLYETYCEMWAEIINVMFISYFTTKSENMDLMIKKTEKMMEKERDYSVFQCAKVLNYFGLSYTELHEKTNMSHIKRMQKYKEETYVLSYFIIKSLMMFCLNDYIEWVVNHNGATLNFNKAPNMVDKNLDEYCGFVREHYQSPEFVRILDEIDVWFSKIKKYNHVELQTLRMSLHEI